MQLIISSQSCFAIEGTANDASCGRCQPSCVTVLMPCFTMSLSNRTYLLQPLLGVCCEQQLGNPAFSGSQQSSPLLHHAARLAHDYTEYALQQSVDARQSRNRAVGPSHFVLCRVAACRKAPEAMAEAEADMGVSSRATVVVVVGAMVVAAVAASMKASSTVGSTTIPKRLVHGPPLADCTSFPLAVKHWGWGSPGLSQLPFSSASPAGSATNNQVNATPG